MFEYHGWATLSERADYDDSAPRGVPEQLLRQVRETLTSEAVSNVWQVADLREVNGQWQVWIAGQRNHRNRPVIEAWEGIAQAAPGSYGLLYVRDDEDPDHGNEWVVWVMARGRIEARQDSFLSPCVPVTEDPEPGY